MSSSRNQAINLRVGGLLCCPMQACREHVDPCVELTQSGEYTLVASEMHKRHPKAARYLGRPCCTRRRVGKLK